MNLQWLTYNGAGLTSHSGYGLGTVDPYNPLDLPPFTLRLKFARGYTPSPPTNPDITWDSKTLVDAAENIWDITRNSTDWYNLLRQNTYLLEVLGANSSSVTSMQGIFQECSSLTKVALFDTRSATRVNGMFNVCTSLTTVPPFDISSATHLSGMFHDCRSLVTVPLMDTRSAIYLNNMFNVCTSLVSVPLFDTRSAENMGGMFAGCTSLTTVPKFDTRNVTSMTMMLMDCTSLTEVPLFDTRSVVDMTAMCQNCYQVSTGHYGLYLRASSQAVPPARHSGTFTRCGRDNPVGAEWLAMIPTSWGGTKT